MSSRIQDTEDIAIIKRHRPCWVGTCTISGHQVHSLSEAESSPPQPDRHSAGPHFPFPGIAWLISSEPWCLESSCLNGVKSLFSCSFQLLALVLFSGARQNRLSFLSFDSPSNISQYTNSSSLPLIFAISPSPPPHPDQTSCPYLTPSLPDPLSASELDTFGLFYFDFISSSGYISLLASQL